MSTTPNPHVHGGDHYRDNTVCAIDLTGCGGTPNDGIRVRAELTLSELTDLIDDLARHQVAEMARRIEKANR